MIRNLSESSRRLVADLHKHPAEVLRGLGESNEPAAIPHVAPYVGSESPRAADAAREAYEKLISLVAADDLTWVDEAVRQSWRSHDLYGPPRTAGFIGATHSVALTGLLSFLPSGYDREAAVNRLRSFTDGSELPYLLLRVNDWVHEVREAARAAVAERVRDDYVDALVRNFSLIARALRTPRSDLRWMLEPLTGLLITAHGQGAVNHTIESGPRSAARAVFYFLIKRVPEKVPAIVSAGVVANDEVIRRWSARLVTEIRALERLTSDSSPAVRREALVRLAESFPAEAPQFLEKGLLDRSGRVREVARFRLRDQQIDFAAMYRNAIHTARSGRQLASAIAALSEVGAQSDTQFVEPYLGHRSAGVRRAAVKGIVRLGGERFADRAAPLLLDGSRSVSAAARNALRHSVSALGRQRLTELFASATVEHSRLHILQLMRELSKWQSITSLLEVATQTNVVVASTARAYVTKWLEQFNRSQAVPSRVELEELSSALVNARTALDDETIHAIRFAVQPFK